LSGPAAERSLAGRVGGRAGLVPAERRARAPMSRWARWLPGFRLRHATLCCWSGCWRRLDAGGGMSPARHFRLEEREISSDPLN